MDSRFAAAEAAFKANQDAEGASLLAAVLRETGAGPAALYQFLAAKLFHLRRYGEAEHWARTGLQQWPREFELWNLLGGALHQQGGRLDAALAAFDEAQRLAPDSLAAQANRAVVLNDMGEGARALELGLELLRRQPGDAGHHRIVAVAHRQLHQYEAAAAHLDTALQLRPNWADLWRERATVASNLLRDDDAVRFMEKALALAPGDAPLTETYAVMLIRADRFKAAEAVLRARLEAGGEPEAWVHVQLARALVNQDRAAANEHFRRAVALEPNNIKVRLALADSLDRSRHGDEGSNLEEAYANLRAALASGPIPSWDAYLVGQIASRVGDFAMAESQGDFAEEGRRLALAGTNGPLLFHLGRVKTPEDRYEVLRQHRLWGERVEATTAQAPLPPRPARPRDGRIRLGFMSSDLRNHPVGYFALPLFQHIDRRRFELYCYSFFVDAEDGIQKYIRDQVTAFRWEKAITSRDAAQMIAADDLDMLIELGGSTAMNKLDVMAYRPAPLQASWLGYPHSSGLATIDYLICDPYVKPERADLMLEKPMVMPHSWLCLGEGRFRDTLPVDPITPEERNGFITFGTANNPRKYGEAMLRTWAKVVTAVPKSHFLWIRPEGGAPSFRDNMRRIFAEEGVEPERLRFEPVWGTHMPFYNQIDIALDTFPLTGGTATCETLWMGVPVVSLFGEAMFERLSYSILTNAGLGDLAVRTPEAFVATAVALAADPARRMWLRAALREQLKASPLGQGEAFARDFYDLVAETVAAHRPGGS